MRPILILACALLACGEPRATPVSRVLLVGMDGLEWSVLMPLLQQGKCPHLRDLMERGSFGKLATFKPTLSPVIWTSIATGKLPAAHGIHDFLDQEGREYTSSRRAAKAMWNVAGDYGLSSNVLGWFVTWPVEEIDGIMVAGCSSAVLVDANWKPALLPDAPQQVHPESMKDELMQLAASAGSLQRVSALVQQEIFGPIAESDLGKVEKKLRQETLWSIQADATYAALAERILAEHPADLSLVYFGGTDVAAHRFWRYYEPAAFRQWFDNPKVDELVKTFEPQAGSIRDLLASPAGEAALAEVIPNYYQWCDELLGRLMAAAGEGTTVIVVSDHGFHASSTDKPNAKFVTGHHQDAPPGVIVAAGPGIARQGAVGDYLKGGSLPVQGNVFSIMPTVLALLGIPPARDFAWRGELPLLDATAAANAKLPAVESHDPGFRPVEMVAMPPQMAAEFKERFGALGYLELQGSEEVELELVDPETFQPDTTSPLPAPR